MSVPRVVAQLKAQKGYTERGLPSNETIRILLNAMATAIVDAGADIRAVQEIRGHASLESTQVYTHVSIQRLRAVHQATHPASTKKSGEGETAIEGDARADLLDELAADDADEAGVPDDEPAG